MRSQRQIAIYLDFKMPLVLALDQGTTSSRAILFNESCEVVATCQRELRQIYPQSGWVEHDPMEIWNDQLAVAEDCLKKANVGATDLSAIGIANQRETTVVWERENGQPIHNAIVWQDRRTAKECERLHREGMESVVRERTGVLIDPYFAATKITWLLDHVPGARADAEQGKLAAGTIDSWLLFQLTGGRVHATDASNASRTMLYDIGRGRWDDELLEIFRVPREMMPEVCSTSGSIAEVDASLPLGRVPVCAMAGDQQAALFGQACFEPGQSKNTYGTGCFLLRHTGDQIVRSQHRLLSTIAWRIDGKTEYALEGSVFVGGAVIQWLRDALNLVEEAQQIEPLVASVENSGGVMMVPAFTGLGAPHWDPHARGLIIGLSRGTTAAHIARAALESIAFQVTDLADAMSADDGHPISELKVDGGASANDGLMQMQADFSQTPVIRPSVRETTALGAGLLAGLATGVWSDRESIAQRWQPEKTFEPVMSADEASQHRERWNDAVERSKAWDK